MLWNVSPQIPPLSMVPKTLAIRLSGSQSSIHSTL